MEIGKVVCSLIGHSRIVDICMGRISCARCGEILVDGLTQAIDSKWETENCLVYRKCPHGSNCKKCAENKKLLIWKDRLLVKCVGLEVLEGCVERT